MTFPDVSPRGRAAVRVQPGDVIAEKYVVEKVLATGGMGLVLAAHHRQLKRRVALKFLLPELTAVKGIVERFLREAQAMTAIQSEHVARVIDVGTASDGAPYMVMEYLEGEDFGEILARRKRVPVAEAVDYLLQAMEALAEAHLNGFVHRDLKPSNLFMTQRSDGSPLVKVLDFGITKALPNDANTGEAELTETRGMLGSPLYMAPEQIHSAKSVDIRADIWALGILLHELVVGRVVFDGTNVATVLAAIVAETPVTLDKAATEALPAGLAQVILKCLARDRADRYSSVAELATALERFAPAEARISIDRIRKIRPQHQRASSSSHAAAEAVTSDSAPDVSELAKTVPLPESDAPASASASERPKKDESTFGKYRLLALLGKGGMADVVLAVVGGPDGLGFSKLVVLKRLRADLAGDQESVSMLVDEARIAAKLNHPNVVQTHEVGEVDDEYYIAMEYLEGQSLHSILERTSADAPMPLAFRLGVVRDLLAGAHHAHELVDFDGTSFGLVHRDISPQNVFVTYDGQVKVLDFGIAKVKDRTTQTQQGIVKGKVRYMPPEQAGAQALDRRADIFAAGVVLWELLTRKRMWDGLDVPAILGKLRLDEIPSSPRAESSDVPEALDAIVAKALSRDPSDRHATAHDLQLEIERYMESEGLTCTPRQLGKWVAELFADRRSEARSLIDAQLAKLRTSAKSPSFRVLKLRGSDSARPSSSSSSRLRLERGDEDSVPEDNSSRRVLLARSDPNLDGGAGGSRLRSRWAVVGGAALVIATAFAIGSLARSKAQDEPQGGPSGSASTASQPLLSPESPEASSTSTVVTPAEAGLVHVSLVASAPGATFAFDDEPKARSPILGTRPRDTEAHRIVVTAPGYRSETKTVTLDDDVVWSVDLVPVQGADGARAPGAADAIAPPPPSTPSAPLVTVAAGSPTAAADASAPSVPPPAASERKKLVLDPDNPY